MASLWINVIKMCIFYSDILSYVRKLFETMKPVYDSLEKSYVNCFDVVDQFDHRSRWVLVVWTWKKWDFEDSWNTIILINYEL